MSSQDELWESFFLVSQETEVTQELAENYVGFVSRHLHDWTSEEDSSANCEWCQEQEQLVIDQILDNPEELFTPWPKEIQKLLMDLMCEKYKSTVDDYNYQATLASTLVVLPYCKTETINDWLDEFENNSSWVSEAEYYEEFLSDLDKVSQNPSVSFVFLEKALNIFHNHVFSECTSDSLANCDLCSSHLAKYLRSKAS